MRRFLLLLLACMLAYPIASYALGAGSAGLGWAGIGGASEEPDSPVPVRMHSDRGRLLHPSRRVPVTGFKAIYSDRATPAAVVFVENVPDIAIKYAWADFHGIESPRFSAYWVGRMRFDKATTRRISVSQSWAKSRIIIDGDVVFDKSNDSATFTHHFGAGDHVVEVEYANNWHTVEFKVTFGDTAPPMTLDEVAGHFDARQARNALHYVGVYESDARDTGVDVTLPATGRPVILWLSSYEAVDWRIAATDRVSAVVVASHAPGSRVTGVGDAKVMRLGGWQGVHSEERRCGCSSGRSRCGEGADLRDLAIQLKEVTGRPLTGHAVRYSASSLSVRAYGDGGIGRGDAATSDAPDRCEDDSDADFDKIIARSLRDAEQAAF